MSAPETPPVPDDAPRKGVGETPSSKPGSVPQASSAGSNVPDKGTRPATGSRSTPSATSSTEGLPRDDVITPEYVEEETQRNDFVIRWAVVLLAMLVATTPIFQTGALVHVKTGEYLAEHGFLPPRTDVFSYTASDRTWINTEWLYDLVAFGAHAAGGAIGLTLLKALLAAITFGFVVHIVRPGVSTWWASICAAVAVMICPLRFSALPESITLLGLAVTLWLLVRWRQSGGALWPLVPVFLLWSNMDQRMFLGLAVLVLYGLGELVSNLLDSPAAFDTPTQRRTFWLVTGACVLAACLNPFGWESLLAPVRMYATEYPAARALFGESPGFRAMQFYPMTTPGYFRTMDIPGVCGLFLLGAAFVASALNHRRLDVGALLVLTGFTSFAFAATHELAAAGLVAAVLGSLAASDWYSERSGPVSTSRGALAFARGGRALTVFGLIAIALLAMNGRLAGTPPLGLGVGLQPDLAMRVEALGDAIAEVPPNYKVFNTRYSQGDLLVWHGLPVFIDGRLGLYAESDGRSVIDDFELVKAKLSKDERAAGEAPGLSVLDEYDVDCALPTMGGQLPSDDYRALFNSPLWRQVAIGGNEAVFVRFDPPGALLDDPPTEHEVERNEFAATHLFDPVEEAFRDPGKPLAQRGDVGHSNSPYAGWLFPEQTKTSADLERSRSMALYTGWIGTGLLGDRVDGAVLFGYSYLTLRQANLALADDPQIAEAYRLLGHTRWFLGSAIEPRFFAPVEGRMPDGYVRIGDFRRVQAVNELVQAVRVDPDNLEAHHSLILAYSGAGQHELVLRHIGAVKRIAQDRGLDAEDLPSLSRILDGEAEKELVARIEPILTEAQKGAEKKAPPEQIASFCLQRGCALTAAGLLQQAEQTDPKLRTNFNVQLFHVRALLEIGALEAATERLAEMEQFPQANDSGEWRQLVALARASSGRYDDAVEMLQVIRGDLEQAYQETLFSHLPFTPAPASLPVLLPAFVTQRGIDADEAVAEWESQWSIRGRLFLTAAERASGERGETGLLVMLLQIESGRLDDARATCRELLTYPDGPTTNLTREYARFLGIDLAPSPEPAVEPMSET